jgi:hypothetical protein
MPTLEKESLHIDLDAIEIEEIEVFLQEGSRGTPEFAASCSTICHYLCCAPSCACVVAGQEEPEADEMDEVLDT